MNDLKNYRENEIKWYVIAYLLLIVVVCYPNTMQDADIDWIVKCEAIITSTLLSGVVCALAFVFDSVFSSRTKDALLYLGFTKVPGSTIFSRICDKTISDTRINVFDAQIRYKEVIENMPSLKERQEYENAKWYAIYSRYQADARVMSVHRDFLLCRDLYITTVSLTLLTLFMASVALLPFSHILIGYLLIMLVVTNLSARNKANRFVNTVIAVDLSSVQK